MHPSVPVLRWVDCGPKYRIYEYGNGCLLCNHFRVRTVSRLPILRTKGMLRYQMSLAPSCRLDIRPSYGRLAVCRQDTHARQAVPQARKPLPQLRYSAVDQGQPLYRTKGWTSVRSLRCSSRSGSRRSHFSLQCIVVYVYMLYHESRRIIKIGDIRPVLSSIDQSCRVFVRCPLVKESEFSASAVAVAVV
ncbi:hypothetical protein BDW02DRAFT_313301 [Decorospora gaudefroyi]|uniref:Uncharacterized protein n=1 Tax=Decorospora gaudefroyi TaxID=184978 RepID=A0A6A5KH69_9PLEO|nr:hypothetical protein BDW02DRAFT_313301 [Decorospora gaudefroyi]